MAKFSLAILLLFSLGCDPRTQPKLSEEPAPVKPAPKSEPVAQLNKWRLNLRSLEALRAEVRELEEKLVAVKQKMGKLAEEMGQSRVEEIKSKR